jgi:hypothetical protein
MEALDRALKQREAWGDVAAFAGNEDIDVFRRSERLERFLAENPAGPFALEARGLLDSLAGQREAALARRKQEAERQRLEALQKAREEKQREETLRLRRLEEAATRRLRSAGDRFAPHGDGTVTDTKTGLMWTLLDSRDRLGRCFDHPSAAPYVNGLDTGGYGDWRLPTSGELAGLYKTPPFFPLNGSPWYWSSEAYVKGYHRVANVVTTRQETALRIDQERQDRCGAVRAVRP